MTTNLNGYAHSWVDKIITITPVNGGAAIENIDAKTVGCSGTIERGTQMANGRVKNTTRGSVTYEGSVTLYRSGWRKVKRGLAAACGEDETDETGVKLLGLVRFHIDIQDKDYVPEADRTTVRLLSCALMGDDEEFAEGNDVEEVTIPIEVRRKIEVIDGVETALL